MRQPIKLHHGPGECVGASWGLCIDKLSHCSFDFILLPRRPPKQRANIRFFLVGQPTPACFYSLLKYKLWFLSSRRNQWVIYLRCLQHQNCLFQNLWRNLCQDWQQNPWWNLIRYFSVFSTLWWVFWVCFVYWPSVVGRPFVVFFGISVSFVLFCYVFVFVDFVIWGGFFPCHVSLGYACLLPFPFLVSFVFLWCYFL